MPPSWRSTKAIWSAAERGVRAATRTPSIPKGQCPRNGVNSMVSLRLSALEHTLRFKAVETKENVNHTHITEHPLLVFRASGNAVRIRFPLMLHRIYLRNERHLFLTPSAYWDVV